jgi:hypothetical protein
MGKSGRVGGEQGGSEIFNKKIKKNLPNFAINFSSIQTNPIYYL